MTKIKNAYLLCHDKNNKNKFPVYGARTIFKVNSSMTQTPNTMGVKVYGVDDYDIGSVMAKAHTLQLFAGVLNQESLIGTGQVVSSKSVEDKTGVYFDIVAVDGDDFYSSPLNRSIKAGITLEQLAIELVDSSNSSAGIGQISTKLRGIAIPRGVSVIGTPIQTMRNIAKAVNAAFYINQGLIYLVCQEEMIGAAVAIDEDDLLSYPVFDGFYASFVTDIVPSVRVGKSVLLPLAKPNSPLYRILKTTIEGDTKNPVWNITAEGAEKTESGFAQNAVTNSVWR